MARTKLTNTNQLGSDWLSVKSFISGRLCPLLTLNNQLVARLMFLAGLEALRELTPRTDRMMASATAFGFALTATHRVIDRVHHHAAHSRTNAKPAAATSLARANIHVIDVADLTDS